MTRSYTSPRRKLQAMQTRKAILDAAQEQFVKRGYDSATIESIAIAANVSSETVYKAFSNKFNILDALISRAIGSYDTPLINRTEPTMLLNSSSADNNDSIQTYVYQLSNLYDSLSHLLIVIRNSIKSDKSIDTLYEKLLKNLHDSLDTFLKDGFKSSGTVNNDFNYATLLDTLWIFASWDVYHLLVQYRNWSKSAYQEWLSELFTTQINTYRSLHD